MDETEDSEIIFKWTNACRICLSLDAQVDLFNSTESESIISNIKSIFNCLIYAGDPLPRKICEQCLQRLKDSCEFRKNGQNTEQELKTKLSNYCKISYVQKYFDRSVKFNSPESLITSSEETSVVERTKTENKAVKIDKDEKVGEIVSVSGAAKDVWNELVGPSIFSPITVIKQENGTQMCYNTQILFQNYSEFESFKSGSTLNLKFCNKCSVSFSNFSLYNTHDCVLNSEVQSLEASGEYTNDDEHILQNDVNLEFDDDSGKKFYRYVKITPWKCTLCDSFFRSKFDFKQHFDNFNCVQFLNNCYKCQYCFRHYLTHDELLEHQIFHITVALELKDEDLIGCDICYKKYPDEERLNQHKLIHILQDNDSFNCKTCEVSFGDQLELDFHLQENKCESKLTVTPKQPVIHFKQKRIPTKCKICGQFVSSRSNCKRHIMTVHHMSSTDCDDHMEEIEDLSGPVRCRLCGVFFQSEIFLKKHETFKHRNKTPLSCKKCHEKFPTRTLLLIHLRDHETNSKSLNNSVENNSSSDVTTSVKTSPNLAVGEETKDGFKCPLCPKISASSYEVVTHILFEHPDKQSEHVPQESQQSKFKCSICSKVFAQGRYLRSHIRKIHNAETTGNKSVGAGGEGKMKESLPAPSSTPTSPSTPAPPEKQKQTARKSTGGHVNVQSASSSSSFALDKHKCTFCLNNFHDLTSHMKKHHKGERADLNMLTKLGIQVDENDSLTCRFCYKKCNNTYSRILHESIHSDVNKWVRCKTCNKKFLSKALYEHHKKVAHKTVTHHCPNCNEYFPKEDLLYTHDCIDKQKDKARKSFKCLKCPRSYDSLKTLKHHITVNHASKEIKIEKEEMFVPLVPPQPSRMEIVRDLWNEESNKIICQVGDKYYCTLCDDEFSTIDLSDTHEKSSHPRGNFYVVEVDDNSYQCTVCDSIFDTNDIEYHMEVHKATDL